MTTKTLADLKKKMNAARSAKDLFGRDPAASFRAMAFICHPDRNPGNAEAEELFKRLSTLHDSLTAKQVVVKSPKKTYKILRTLAAGDAADGEGAGDLAADFSHRLYGHGFIAFVVEKARRPALGIISSYAFEVDQGAVLSAQ